jgi:signal transduction histidine kinase
MPWRSQSATRSSIRRLLWLLPLAGAAAAIGRRRRNAAREQEAERGRLAARLITAEQDERRRLSVLLHDGPLQSLSGIVLMHDAALGALREGRVSEAVSLVEGALGRERATIQELRDLSFAIEPVILRDRSFEAAVRQLGDQLERARRIQVDVDAAPGDGIGEKAQVALYQVLREALSQAAGRRPERVRVRVVRSDGGGYDATVHDDGVAERRRASVEALEERARVLGARVAVETSEAGTLVSIAIPPYVATPR